MRTLLKQLLFHFLVWPSLSVFALATCRVAAQTLPRYSCLNKEYDTELWMKQYDRHLDSAGIVVQKGAYHPLSIAFYGIMNYEDYLITRDSACIKRLRDQFQYFTKPGHLTLTADSLGAGLPYRFAFKDLKPPWYSGMTQGVAISFMLRYYLLSHDVAALDLAQKFAQFMLKTVEYGGTIGTTPEGYTWIEEYPKSKQSPQVLNGFINGLIGLYEYLQFFPGDTLARRVHDEAYEGLLCTLPLYDIHNWSNYNRKISSLTKQYMRYEIAELEHLIEIYHEPMLQRQMQIWSFFAQGKQDTILKFYRNPKYEFGAKLVAEHQVGIWTDSLFYELGFASLKACRVGKRKKMSPFPITWKTSKPLLLTFPNLSKSIFFELGSTAQQPSCQIEAFDQQGKPIPVTVSVDGKIIRVHSCESFKQIVLQTSEKKKGAVTLRELKVFDPENGKLPPFVASSVPQTYTFKMGDHCKFSFEGENLCDLILFYKYTPINGGNIGQARWMAERYIADPSVVFVVPEDGIYSFMYSFPFLHPQPRLMKFDAEVVR